MAKNISSGPLSFGGGLYSSKTCFLIGKAAFLTSAVALTIIGALALVGLGRASTLSCFGHALGRSAAIAFTAIGATLTAAMLAVYFQSYCCRPKEKPALPVEEPTVVPPGYPLPPEPHTPLREPQICAGASPEENRAPPVGYGYYEPFGPSPERPHREALRQSSAYGYNSDPMDPFTSTRVVEQPSDSWRDEADAWRDAASLPGGPPPAWR